tara:strand:+ start:1254 stop:1973 length:720 start_codon:yes stop_codon:yes gene_type:complete
MGTATTIAMAVSSAAKAGAGFIQANKQKNMMEQAQRDADKFMKEARDKLQTNYYDELSLSMVPYDLAREQNRITSSAIMQAALEGSERGGAATAGKVLQASQKLEGDIMSKQIQDLQALEKLSADEDTKIKTDLAQLDLAEYSKKIDEAAAAEKIRAAKLQQGIAGATELVGMGIEEFAPLFSKKEASSLDLSGLGFKDTREGLLGIDNIGQGLSLGNNTQSGLFDIPENSILFQPLNL